MEEIRLTNYQALWLLWLLPILAVVYGYSFYRKKKALSGFAEIELLSRINTNVSIKRQLVRAALLLTAVLAIVIALTGPGWNPQPEKIQRKGRDIVILLDVSRSMMAEDIYPNRLERAKLEVSELLSSLHGDRVGIIAFAGVPVVKCPLTRDYGFVRLTLAELGPRSVSRGGTNLGDAIRKAATEVFDQRERDYKDIILITDGEDQDSLPVEAAAAAARQGVRIFAIGLGDQSEGKRIPVTGPDGEKTFLKYQGQEIWSRLNGDTLREIAYATPGGKYLSVGTDTFDLKEVYHSLSAGSGKKQSESATILKYDEKFQIMLAAALALLIIEVCIGERKKI